jgi:hypothetical protein
MKKDKQSCRLIHLLGAPGTGKSRTCIELNNILLQYANQSSSEMKQLIQNAIHIKATYINGTGPTERDGIPSYGLAWRIIKSIDLTPEDVVRGNDLLDSVFLTIASKKKKEHGLEGPILICLCIDDYNQIIRYFNTEGRGLLKKLTSSVGNCMLNPNYILFPIFSGTIDLSIEKGVFTGSFFPSTTIMTSLLGINDINEIIRELSKMKSYGFLKPLLNNRNFIRLVQSIGTSSLFGIFDSNH